MTPDPDIDGEDREDLATLATVITEEVDIRLEHEAHYDWVAFVPQRSTASFIKDIQRGCLNQLNATRSPDAVLGQLERATDELQASNVAVELLVE